MELLFLEKNVAAEDSQKRRKEKKWRLGRKSPFVPLKICLPLLLSQPRRTDQTGTTRLPNDRSERPVLTNGTRPLSIEVKPSHDHKMIKLPAFDNLFRHKDILAENAKTRSKMATAIAFSRQNRDFKIQRRGGNDNVA